MTETAPAPAPATASPAAAPATKRSMWDIITRLPILQVAALAALAIWGVATVPALAEPVAIMSILALAALVGLASIGQTLVALLGGLDLAVPGYISVGAFAATTLATADHWPLPFAIIAGALCGMSIGAATGLLCYRLKLQPLVVTLGTGSIMTGGVLILNGGNFIAAPPAALNDFASLSATTLGLPIPPLVSLWLLVTVVVGLILARTLIGRRFYATGANPTAAAFVRIRTVRPWVAAFAANGALTTLSGVLIAGFTNGSTAQIGDPYLYAGLAAVFVGGTTFGAVRGSYTRTALGALILTLLTTVLVGLGFSDAQSQILYGAILLVVVAVYGRERRLRDRL